MIRSLTIGCLLLLTPAVVLAFGKERPPARNGAYLDVSWLNSSTRPDNRTWRTKGTSWKLDGLELFSAAVASGREPTAGFRLGYSIGVQTGWDVDKLVSDTGSSRADWRYLYYTYLSYLFPANKGLKVKAGLIPGNLGYENFHGMDNPTYTREYGVDMVPYFHWGVWADWKLNDALGAGLLIVNGWNYLETLNNSPSYGAQFIWDATDRMQIKQNIYYGPEQASTSLEYWRFVTQTIAEWAIEDFMLVGSFAWATEDQDLPAGAVNATWWWAALWAQWQPDPRWQFTVRPEVYDDPDGVGSGSQQKLRAITVGGEYRISPVKMNTLSARVEYRFDRSTGPGGGFYEGEFNTLTPDQQLFMVALMWRFDTKS